jgi:hypothetical protein
MRPAEGMEDQIARMGRNGSRRSTKLFLWPVANPIVQKPYKNPSHRRLPLVVCLLTSNPVQKSNGEIKNANGQGNRAFNTSIEWTMMIPRESVRALVTRFTHQLRRNGGPDFNLAGYLVPRFHASPSHSGRDGG